MNALVKYKRPCIVVPAFVMESYSDFMYDKLDSRREVPTRIYMHNTAEPFNVIELDSTKCTNMKKVGEFCILEVVGYINTVQGALETTVHLREGIQ